MDFFLIYVLPFLITIALFFSPFIFIANIEKKQKVTLIYTVATDIIGSIYIGTSSTEDFSSLSKAESKVKHLRRHQYLMSFEIKDFRGKIINSWSK